MKKYPRIGSQKKLSVKSRKQCKFCSEVASSRIDVEWNHFRGDDDVYNVCDVHLESEQMFNG